jgi:hypothetical protein
MSITAYQYSNQLNQANSDLLWVVSSSFTTRPQYQYICVLKDGCGTDLTTIKQQPNPSGKGVFDLGRIARQYIGFDTDNTMFTAGASNYFYKMPTSSRYFKVAFGEQYGTSPSSSVLIYNGINNTTPAVPAYTGSVPHYFFLNGVVDPNSGAWNWNTSSYYIPQTTPSSLTFNYNVALTEASRTQSAFPYDYMNIQFINGNIATGSSTVAQDIYGMNIDVYDSETLVHTEFAYNQTDFTLNSGGPRSTDAQLWSNVSQLNTCFNTSSLMSVGMGPQNITDRTNYDLLTQPWTHYTVTLLGQQASATPNVNGIYESFRINKQDPNCGYDRVRFAFFNNLGGWDWFNFTLANTKTTTMERSTYKASFVDYSTTTPSVPYNKQRRGQTTYNIDLDEIFIINSNWLTQEEADWLEQLFYSPNIYIQDGGQMIPIIIENAEVVSKTNPKSQKLFKYDVTYRLANSKRSR